MVCDRNIRRRVYVSKDAEPLEFVDMASGDISGERMDTSGFVIRMHERGHVNDDDIRHILSSDSRRPNRVCEERLEHVVWMGSG